MDSRARTASNRRVLADFLDGLDDDQLRTRSLCHAWTEREVLGHLVMPLTGSVGGFLVHVVRAHGSLDRASEAISSDLSRRPISELTSLLRDRADQHGKAPGVGPMGQMADGCLHAPRLCATLGSFDRRDPRRPAHDAELAAIRCAWPCSEAARKGPALDGRRPRLVIGRRRGGQRTQRGDGHGPRRAGRSPQGSPRVRRRSPPRSCVRTSVATHSPAAIRTVMPISVRRGTSDRDALPAAGRLIDRSPAQGRQAPNLLAELATETGA